MENKIIPYEDIINQFASFLKTLDEIPFGFFFDNEEISLDKFAVLFDYLKPTLPLLSYITMLRTENPDVTFDDVNNLNFIFFDTKLSSTGLKVIKFNNWVGFYSDMVTSFNKDFVISKNNLKNYNLMYKYIIRLKNCVRIIDDFFLVLDIPKNHLTSIYKTISDKALKVLIKLTGFFGNYIMEKKGCIGPFDRNNTIYVRNPETHDIIYNPFTVENQNLPTPTEADLGAIRGGTGNPIVFIPQTRANIIAQRMATIYERQEGQRLRAQQERVVEETLDILLRTAT